MKTAAQNSESATEPESFEQYLSLKSQSPTISDPPDEAHSLKEEKAAPDSDPDKETQEKTKELTDEAKAARKARNDRRREERWWEERGRMRAENDRLKREVEELRRPKPDSAPAARAGKPSLQAFLDSGKFKTYEEAQEAYQDARDDWFRKQWEAEQEQKHASRTAQSDERDIQRALKADIKDFVKTAKVDDFDDAYQVVVDALDNEDGQGNPITTRLLKSKNPAALIYHLGTNEAILDRLAELTASGDFVAATEYLGEIKAVLSSKKSAPPEKTEISKEPPPRPPKTVGARGSVPSRDDQLRAAAEADDFQAFRKASRAKG